MISNTLLRHLIHTVGWRCNMLLWLLLIAAMKLATPTNPTGQPSGQPTAYPSAATECNIPGVHPYHGSCALAPVGRNLPCIVSD